MTPELSASDDVNKIVTILAIAVVTLVILLTMNIYKVQKLKARLNPLITSNHKM